MRIWALVALAMALGACAGSREEEGGVAIREVDSIADSGEQPTIPGGPSAQFLRETRVFGDAAPIPNIQQAYGIAPVILDPGAYTFEALGTPLTLHLPEHWRLDQEYPGYFALTRPGAELDSLLPALSFQRPVGFADPALAGGLPTISPNGWPWPRDDLAGWIEQMPQVVVVGEGAVSVDQRRVRWWDIDVDPTLGPTSKFCQPGACVSLMWSGTHLISVARDLERIRWYEIADPLGPIVVFVSAPESDWEEFVADSHELLLSVEFGVSSPNPLLGSTVNARQLALAASTAWSFSSIPGVTLTSANFFSILQRPGELSASRGPQANANARVGLVKPLSDIEGRAIGTVGDIAAALESSGAVPVLAEIEILGMPAIAFDLEHRAGPGALLLAEERPGFSSDQAVWPNLELNRAWVFDSPIGPAMIVVSGATDFEFEQAQKDLAWFTSAIEFCSEETEFCHG